MEFRLWVLALFGWSALVGLMNDRAIQYYPGARVGTVAADSFPLLAPDGSSSAPSYSWSGATNSGLFRDGSDRLVAKGQDATGTNVNAALTGAVYVYGGLGTGGGNSGHVAIYIGEPEAPGSTPHTPQEAFFLNGSSASFNLGGMSTASDPASSAIEGANTTKSNTAGGALTITAGGAGAGNANGGNVTVQGGAGIGTGLAGYVLIQSRLFASLGAASNGALAYCSDCAKATPCAGSGSGAFAKRINGAWDCD